MFKNLNKKKITIAGLIALIPLNILAFFFIKENIGITLALNNIHNPQEINVLQEKMIAGNFFSAVVFTLDIVFILFLLYLLFKTLTRSLKN
jgi:hypothetical protein